MGARSSLPHFVDATDLERWADRIEARARSTDSGNFSYFAGPVSKAAADKCVKWGGAVGDNDYTSPFEHCG